MQGSDSHCRTVHSANVTPPCVRVMRVLLLIAAGCVLVAASPTARSSEQSKPCTDTASSTRIPTTPASVTPARSGSFPCLDPASRSGYCTTLRRCPELFALVANGHRPTPAEIANLRASTKTCPSQNGQLLVCCVRSPSGPFVGQPEDHPNRAVLQRSTCSLSISNRIVGGTTADLGQFPWFAAIGYSQPSSGRADTVTFECSGALISERHVLTAAHCVTGLPDSVRLSSVRLGEHRLDRQDDCRSPGADSIACAMLQDFQIVELFIHADYNKPARRMNDIALLKLDRPVSFNTFAQTICLPFGDVRRQNYTGMDLTAVGFASVADDAGQLLLGGKLEQLKLPAVDHAVCAEQVRQLGGKLGPRQLCAGGQLGRDLCFGDSGAPLMTRSDSGRYSVVGLVAYGDIMCEGNAPGVFTRVADYLNWILDRIQ